ncbi:hypothetical protein KFL_005610080 [Klebsormidium nitens]|uniref:Uncharacterized protein n=1 Tax=Klebsormidium nitens TaxID=105231 RepID=A0A1Y1IKW2_KLENI|nr:hypothetical protein KFL_005610080 [Klebsormidium nitens]|eukprot:GAQ89781.1 hypothetical protein KFL_005610080 [Klebsormidium nitens]
MATFLHSSEFVFQFPATSPTTSLKYVDPFEVHPFGTSPQVTFLLTSSLPASEWTPELQKQLVTVLVADVGFSYYGGTTVVHAGNPTVISGQLTHNSLERARKDSLAFLREFYGDHILAFDVHVAATLRCYMRGVYFAIYMISPARHSHDDYPEPEGSESCCEPGLQMGDGEQNASSEMQVHTPACLISDVSRSFSWGPFEFLEVRISDVTQTGVRLHLQTYGRLPVYVTISCQAIGHKTWPPEDGTAFYTPTLLPEERVRHLPDTDLKEGAAVVLTFPASFAEGPRPILRFEVSIFRISHEVPCPLLHKGAVVVDPSGPQLDGPLRYLYFSNVEEADKHRADSRFPGLTARGFPGLRPGNGLADDLPGVGGSLGKGSPEIRPGK